MRHRKRRRKEAVLRSKHSCAIAERNDLLHTFMLAPLVFTGGAHAEAQEAQLERSCVAIQALLCCSKKKNDLLHTFMLAPLMSAQGPGAEAQQAQLSRSSAAIKAHLCYGSLAALHHHLFPSAS